MRMAAAGDVQPAVFRLFGTDGNQILIRGQPVHHVEREIAVGDGRAQNDVGHPVGTAHHDDAACLRAGADGCRRAQNERAFLRLLRDRLP